MTVFLVTNNYGRVKATKRVQAKMLGRSLLSV